jgi:hypothetical protein
LNKLIKGEISFRRVARKLPEIVCKEFIEILFMNMVQTMNGYIPEQLKQIRIK